MCLNSLYRCLQRGYLCVLIHYIGVRRGCPCVLTHYICEGHYIYTKFEEDVVSKIEKCASIVPPIDY